MKLYRGLIPLILMATMQLSSVRAIEPWAIVTGQSVVEVRGVLRHIYHRLGRKDLVAALDSAAVTNLMTGNLKGLALNKPLGCLVMPNASGTGSILTFIAITNESDFRGFLLRHGLRAGSEEQGITPVQIPIWGTVFARFVNQHAWFALNAQELTQSLPDLEQTIPALHRQTALAATIYLERLPADQRQVWLQRGEQGLQWLLQGSVSGPAALSELVGLPLAGTLMHRLADEGRELTLLASVDPKKDQLWAEAVVVPRPDTPWMKEAQDRAQHPKTIDLPVKSWALIRGTSEEFAAKAAETTFTAPGQDQLHLSITGGDALHWRVDMSGAVLAYYAALGKDPAALEKKERHQQRREEKRAQRHSIPPG